MEAAPLTGSNLAGRYRLLQTIGEGGMGRIYRAEQIATGQPVAGHVVRHDSYSAASGCESWIAIGM